MSVYSWTNSNRHPSPQACVEAVLFHQSLELSDSGHFDNAFVVCIIYLSNLPSDQKAQVIKFANELKPWKEGVFSKKSA